jgi:hypothetical protein
MIDKALRDLASAISELLSYHTFLPPPASLDPCCTSVTGVLWPLGLCICYYLCLDVFFPDTPMDHYLTSVRSFPKCSKIKVPSPAFPIPLPPTLLFSSSYFTLSNSTYAWHISPGDVAWNPFFTEEERDLKHQRGHPSTSNSAFPFKSIFLFSICLEQRFPSLTLKLFVSYVPGMSSVNGS